MIHSLPNIIEQVIEHDGRNVDLDFKEFGGSHPSIRERMRTIVARDPGAPREDAA